MPGPRPDLVAAIVRAADRGGDGGEPGTGAPHSGGEPGTGDADPTLDAVAERVQVPGGPLHLLRPRDPDALAFETVSAPDAEVEELHPPHWARLWASGTALARVVDAPPPPPTVAGRDGAGRIVVRGRSVLELGCGLGLPALTAARAGARVLATDRALGAVAYVAATAAREGIDLHSASCTWDAAEPLVEQGPWDVVLAADVIYGQEALTVLAALLPRLAADDGEVWLADPRRPLTPEFLADARSRWREVDTRESPVQGVRLHRLRGPIRTPTHAPR
ncbi:methyltransferase [Pseudonocardia sp. KRD291]|uniref:class I SAM-dependent methyltransferase n=1 Tax=Pseudonocardia sp. KRD291 TaxID=2792007 RepID=UPI001C4A34F2|nr:methyltransferase domain-containing protein [Pseudonocardia sp. KRD291]MBW0102255.1 hypothetical protein [Pseudonocardia sp. KRD291]